MASSSVATQRMQRRVAWATVVGTTIEWYDFFIYSTAAGLVFATLFFSEAGPGMATLASFATVAISFVLRPLGAVWAGYLGDRYGRKLVLILTLLLMGVATTLIGLLPTYAQIGVAAPVILIALRILQGISAGGEWGSAALMAVEHAPDKKRGIRGALPQLGVPLGLLLASGVNALMAGVIAPGDAYLEWGWRVPFLLSAALIVIGFLIRRGVDETPAFRDQQSTGAPLRNPLGSLLRRFWPVVLLGALAAAGTPSVGNLLTGGFLTSYATSDAVGHSPSNVLLALMLASLLNIPFVLFGGALADRIGRFRTYGIGLGIQIVGILPMFWLVDTGSMVLLLVAVTVITVGLGLGYGTQAVLLSGLFPTDVRLSGISITYSLGAILAGFVPLLAQAILIATGSAIGIAVMVIVAGLVALLALLGVKRLSQDHFSAAASDPSLTPEQN